ncbi:MAG: hypothetical protein JJE40_08505 [Vicinamibacteria bacterium]|nr:hypothetical protein [Vicinamibacteria bacterium]
MDNLEKIVEPLRELPDRVTKVEAQIVQLRTEMRDEFSAIRRDMVTKEDLTRFATKEDLTRFATKDDLTRFATKVDLAEAIAPLATKEELAKAVAPLATKEELAKAVAPLATKDEMRMLHEDLVERLKVIGEAQARPATRSRKTP